MLESFYRVPHAKVAEAMRSLIAFKAVITVDPALLLRALEVYEVDVSTSPRLTWWPAPRVPQSTRSCPRQVHRQNHDSRGVLSLRRSPDRAFRQRQHSDSANPYFDKAAMSPGTRSGDRRTSRATWSRTEPPITKRRHQTHARGRIPPSVRLLDLGSAQEQQADHEGMTIQIIVVEASIAHFSRCPLRHEERLLRCVPVDPRLQVLEPGRTWARRTRFPA